MKLEHNLLIQGLIELKWMSKEAVPLLSTKMYEAEVSTVGKLRAHGLTSEAIFEAAIFANQTAENPLPVVDLALMRPIQNFDFATFASLEEMLAQFVAPIMQLGERLVVATADPSNAKFFDILALRFPFPIDYWIAESEAIKASLLAMNVAAITGSSTSVVEKGAEIPISEAPVVETSIVETPAIETPVVEAPVVASKPLTERRLDERIEPTLSVEPSDQLIEEPVITTEFTDDYLEEETVRYVDLDELPENAEDDNSERFAALQDFALDVDELESKSQDLDEETLRDDGLDAVAIESSEEALEGQCVDDPIASGDVAASLLAKEIREDLEYAKTASADIDMPAINPVAAHDNDALQIDQPQSAPADPEVTFSTNKSVPLEAAVLETSSINDIDDAQSSAVMLREILDEVGSKAKGAPVTDDIIEYINYILLDAITQKASDIHFEPYESSYRIRFRIDGILHKVYVVPEQYRHTIASRLKVMAELDIAEKRLPQDGHITICLGDEKDDEVDARISVIPTLWGEKVVIRLLDRAEMNMSLAKLGLSHNQKNQLQSAIERSQGLVLVTGPTGSGKTVTLYACLNHLNQASRNIATVEDPIEINLEGINQLQVHPKIGLDFAEALRAFLRQDPDVLMVGEIRDYETADITLKAAQTGHLVLSTLHTNSAVESLLRLQNMGIEAYNTASTVKLIVAQRLVRALCHCKEEDIVDSGYLETLGFTPQQAASKFYRASGCSECHDGYRGRFAIFEVMPISKRMAQLMLESAPASEIHQQAEREGVKSLRQSGIDKIMEGRTSLEEVLRVTTE